MITSHESPKFSKTLRRGAALVAILGATGAAAPASAETAEHNKFKTKAQLEKQVESRIGHSKVVAFLRGDVSILETVKDPIEPKLTHSVYLNLKNAFLVDRHSANIQSGFKFIEGGGYAVGYMDQKAKKPDVHLISYNSSNMTFTPENTDGGPTIEYFFFGKDAHGNPDLHNPGVSYDGKPHGGPLVDAAGNPEPVALAYVPQK